MIQCKDFAPHITEQGLFGGASEYESFSEVVSAVNQWIENTTTQVINVETVVLPDRIEGTSGGDYGLTVSNSFHPVMISCYARSGSDPSDSDRFSGQTARIAGGK